MDKNEIKKLTAKSSAELTKDISEAKEKLWETHRDVKSGKVKNSHLIGELRRDIARMLTVVQNKKLAEKTAGKQVTSNK
jgi:ribosomal protein L29